MRDVTSKKTSISESSLLTRTIAPEDAAVMTAIRAAALPLKGKLQGIAAREPFNGIMERVSLPERVDFHTDTVATTSGGAIPVGAAVLSPVTDLALTGPSFETRSEADPYFVRSQVEGLVRSYLGDTDPKNPLTSPLYGNLAGLPPISIHVGDDEVLLDDSRRYFEHYCGAHTALLDRLDYTPPTIVASSRGRDINLVQKKS